MNTEKNEIKNAEWRKKNLSKNSVLADAIKSFACLDEKQECDKQCGACKFVEDGLKKQANVL